jgi:HAD superfamily hydrolase (TIGR01459 family)
MEHLDHFAPLAARYDGFVLDLWGVIHDGVSPYPGAVDCLERLRAAAKRVVLLSNAPRRAAHAAAAMRAMGIGDALYDGIVTSGEVTHALLRDRTDPAFAALGRRLFHIGPERDRNVFDTLDVESVAEPAAATFVLNTGPDDSRLPTEIGPWEAMLRACRQAGLPMVCANPDLEVIRGGERVICAGALAQHYATLGGHVIWVGKPDPAVYRPVLDALGVAKVRVLAVGDGLRTDIAGAAAAGLDAAWVLGGIHGVALAGAALAAPDAAEAMARRAGRAPLATPPPQRG